MSQEIFEDVVSCLANRSEVIGASTGTEGKNTIKLLVSVRAYFPTSILTYLFELLLISLVDCAEDGQTLIREATEQRNNACCTLAIEATCRFIQEQEQPRPSAKFHANRHSLLLLDVQRADHRILQFDQVQGLQNRLHICKLFCLGYVIALSKQGGKFESFANRATLVVDVHLLTVSNLTVERVVNWVVVHVQRTKQLAGSLPLGQCGQHYTSNS